MLMVAGSETTHHRRGTPPLVAAVILWNTRYLQTASGMDVPRLHPTFALLDWEHIALTVDYVWGVDPLPKEGLRPLKRPTSMLVA